MGSMGQHEHEKKINKHKHVVVHEKALGDRTTATGNAPKPIFPS